MTAIVFDGREFAREKTERLVREVGGFRDVGKTPKLVAILVGNNKESELYLRLKEKAAKRLGVEFEFKKFSGNSPQEILDFIKESNLDPSVNGIIIELPLPEKYLILNTEYKILDSIDSKKDVDCLTSENKKLLEEGQPRFTPPTIKAVGEILETEIRSKKLEAGKRIVVVGSKGVVGKGILAYLKGQEEQEGKEGLEIVGIDKEIKDLALVTKEADVLISATGVGYLIKKEMVKEGAVVIDVGIEKQKDGTVKGDVDFERVKEIASFITPVPGGVGPVTVICLMENLLQTVYHELSV